MTAEEIKALLGSEEAKEVVKQMAKEMGYESPEEIAGLKNKNNELLGLNKTFKSKLSELESKIADIDLDDYNIFKEKGTGNKTLDEINSLKRQLNTTETKFKEESEKRSKAENVLFNKIKENEMNRIFDELGVDSKYKKLLTSAFKDKVKTEGDYDKVEVIVDAEGTGHGLPASEYFKQWVSSEEGKPYLKTIESRGTGSHTFNNKSAKTISRADFDKLNVDERSSLMKNGITIE